MLQVREEAAADVSEAAADGGVHVVWGQQLEKGASSCLCCKIQTAQQQKGFRLPLITRFSQRDEIVYPQEV